MSCKECIEVSRRRFLQQSGLTAGAVALAHPLLRFAAPTYAAAAGGAGNILVLCQLEGGMDALSFLAPFTNAQYISARPRLALNAAAVTPLPDRPEYGIGRLFPYFSQLYAQGQCAIVQQVGYPDGNGSHFESQDIFEFGVRNLGNASGTAATWYERLRAAYFDQPYGVMDTRRIGDPQRYGYPDSSTHRPAQNGFGRLAELKLAMARHTGPQSSVVQAYSHIDFVGSTIQQRTASFTSSGSARGDFYYAAALASADLGTQIFKVKYGGFDTHGTQATANQTLFPRLNNEFQQFATDMQNLGMWDRTTVVFYTEFGRRNYENGSPGTDHGWGGHMILCGPRVRGGLYGQNVTTSDLLEGALPSYVDFRAVFSSCIRDWLGFDPRPVFQLDGETYDENVGGVLFR